MTTKAAPKIVPTHFDSWRSAFIWAYHVARTSHHKTKVQKINGDWCAWRLP